LKKLWNRDFVLLLQGTVVSTLGDLMYSVAIGYWVFEKTGSSSLMGIMSAVSMFVTMILSPFAGSIVDKCNRKWVLVGMDLLQAAVMLTVGVLVWLDLLNIPGILIAAFLAAMGSVFYSPASGTLMIDLIPRDDMVRGQSLFSGATSLVNLLGSALSGVLVAFLGVPLIVILNGVSNLYSALTELFIRVPRTVGQGSPISVKGTLKDYGRAALTVFRDPHLSLFVPCILLLNLLTAGPLTLILPFTAEKGFTVDMYGYIMATWIAASLLAVLILGAVKLSPRLRFWVMAVGFSLSGVFLVLAYLSNLFLPVCVFVFLGAFCNAAGNTVFNAALMLALPEENRGTILGFIGAASVGGSALSAVAYGCLGDVFPMSLVFAIGTLLSLVPMLYLCFHPRTKAFILAN
jgi:MFS family permease